MRELTPQEYLHLDLTAYASAGQYCFGQIVDNGFYIVRVISGILHVYECGSPGEMRHEFEVLGRRMDLLNAMKNAIAARRP